jgi:hypothetical protein
VQLHFRTSCAGGSPGAVRRYGGLNGSVRKRMNLTCPQEQDPVYGRLCGSTSVGVVGFGVGALGRVSSVNAILIAVIS